MTKTSTQKDKLTTTNSTMIEILESIIV